MDTSANSGIRSGKGCQTDDAEGFDSGESMVLRKTASIVFSRHNGERYNDWRIHACGG